MLTKPDGHLCSYVHSKSTRTTLIDLSKFDTRNPIHFFQGIRRPMRDVGIERFNKK
jgi:hypothetical protein